MILRSLWPRSVSLHGKLSCAEAGNVKALTALSRRKSSSWSLQARHHSIHGQSDRLFPVLQALFDLEATNNELKADLRDLYITAAKEVDVAGSQRKAIIVHVSSGYAHYGYAFLAKRGPTYCMEQASVLIRLA